MSINKVVISGNLGGDADLRTTQGGLAVLSFSMCVNDRIKRGDKWEDKPNWIDCVMFGTRADKLAQYLTKGTHATVAGKLSQETWEKDGQKRSKVKVIVDDIDFQGAKKEQPQQVEAVIYDDEVPF